MVSGGRDPSDRSKPRRLAEELGKKRPFDQPEVEVYLNLLRTCEHLRVAFDELFKSRGLSQNQYNTLRILRGHAGPVPTGTVARELVHREPDATRLLNRLVELGYVTKTRPEHDKRIVHATITDKGRAILADLDEPVRALHTSQLAHLPEDDLRRLSRLLERVRGLDPPA